MEPASRPSISPSPSYYPPSVTVESETILAENRPEITPKLLFENNNSPSQGTINEKTILAPEISTMTPSELSNNKSPEYSYEESKILVPSGTPSVTPLSVENSPIFTIDDGVVLGVFKGENLEVRVKSLENQQNPFQILLRGSIQILPVKICFLAN